MNDKEIETKIKDLKLKLKNLEMKQARDQERLKVKEEESQKLIEKIKLLHPDFDPEKIDEQILEMEQSLVAEIKEFEDELNKIYTETQ